MPTLTRTDSVVAKRLQLPAEKEVIAGWNLGGDHSVKGNEQFLGYMHVQSLDIEPYRLNAKV